VNGVWHNKFTACCACGRGSNVGQQDVSESCQDFSPTWHQNGIEQNWWHDSGGTDYDCAWYGENPGFRCLEYGSEFSNGGKTATEACCVCGGGE
jgi:hypothetical protein